ncbi:hypothetical protein BC826DRAFT_1054750, partial [Russula brevipes]
MNCLRCGISLTQWRSQSSDRPSRVSMGVSIRTRKSPKYALWPLKVNLARAGKTVRACGGGLGRKVRVSNQSI